MAPSHQLGYKTLGASKAFHRAGTCLRKVRRTSILVSSSVCLSHSLHRPDETIRSSKLQSALPRIGSYILLNSHATHLYT